MWSRTYSQKVTDSSAAQLWQVWADVNRGHTWQDNIEYAKLAGEFCFGSKVPVKTQSQL
jgi:hypothetical protein